MPETWTSEAAYNNGLAIEVFAKFCREHLPRFSMRNMIGERGRVTIPSHSRWTPEDEENRLGALRVAKWRARQ